MKILVCISCVPETTSKINFVENDTQFDKNGIKFVINPNDEFGLTRAIWIKEKDNSSIDVINVGLEDSDPILRKTLAIGADKAIRINSNPIDSFQVAKLIADHISKNNYVNDNPAIIFDKQVDLRTEPNLRSEEINTLHEGTKLNIIEKIDDWSYIELKNGNKGWLTSSSYRLIR